MPENKSLLPYFIVNIEAAIRKENRWLMCIRSEKESQAGGMLSLVGGKLEYSDPVKFSIEEAVKREVLEETGLRVSPIDYIHSSIFISNKGNHVLDIVYLCTITGESDRMKTSDEIQELKWMTIEEIKQHPRAQKWLIDSIKLVEDLYKRT